MKKPNVLVAGFPKSGTTFLYHLLKQHPDIFIPKIKELNYFNKDHFFPGNPEILNPRYFKPVEWYYKFFDTDKKIVIDFSILSALDTQSAKRAKKELGDIKILFITRNKEDFLNSMKKFMDLEGGDYEGYEEYADFDYYIENYKRHFSNVLVVKLEDINNNPEEELNKITNFFGLKNHKFITDMPRHQTKDYQMGKFQYLKRYIYIKLIRVFYKLISFTVIAKIKAQGEK